jgi:hypothetical protein
MGSLFAVVSVAAIQAFASPAQTANSGAVNARISFLNSQTGYSILPDMATVLCGAARQRLNIAADGTAMAKVWGKTCILNVEQYIPKLGKRITVLTTELELAKTLEHVVWLAPIASAPELESSFIKGLIKPDTATIIGFVVDDQTNRPLPGVTVSSPDTRQTPVTNERGFYTISIPVKAAPKAGTRGPPTTTLQFRHEGYTDEMRDGVELVTGVAPIYRIRLRRGSTVRVREIPQRPLSPQTPPEYPWVGSKMSLPSVIRVGVGCKGVVCSAMYYMNLEEYCKKVLAAEWPGAAINAHAMEALKAGAVAVRTYALAFSAQLYICSTPACQALNGRSFVETDAAVFATSGIALANGRKMALAEYAAETNDSGCGDGFSGEKQGSHFTSPCIPDPVCKGQQHRGHGRGMCQSGSVRWAMLGAAQSDKPKDWLWILHHYYPTYTVIPSRCDLNNDFSITQADVDIAISAVLGTVQCSPNEDLDLNGACNVVDVQRVINAALTGSCFSGQ